MADTKIRKASDGSEGSGRTRLASASVGVRVDDLSVNYGTVKAVRHVSVKIHPGEMYFLLGPSGCGKTSLLRAIAGFVEEARGHVYVGDERIDHVPPHKRGTAMVFQNYALWPHMTVRDNVAYGLEVKQLKAADIEAKVKAALEMVGLTDLAKRRPGELSGGQQQRVALARAVVVEPRVVLMDEPLSNLDAKLRAEMRREIRRIVRSTGVTAVYVTHDQREALSMADRIGVMNEGRLVQEGKPGEIYRYPSEPFVATFLGEANRFGGRILSADRETLLLDTPLGEMPLPAEAARSMSPTAGAELPLFVRPEAVRLGATRRQGAVKFKAVVGEATFQGENAHFVLAVKQDGKKDVITLTALQYNPRGVLLEEGREVDAFVEVTDVGIIGAAPPPES